MISRLSRRTARIVSGAAVASVSVSGLTFTALEAQQVAGPVSTASSSDLAPAAYHRSARLTVHHRRWVNMANSYRTASDSDRSYVGVAYIRSERHRARAVLRMRHVAGSGHVYRSRTVSFTATPQSWRRVQVAFASGSEAGSVQLWATAQVSGRAAVRVTGVSIRRRENLPVPTPAPDQSPTPSPSSPSSPTPTPTPTPTTPASPSSPASPSTPPSSAPSSPSTSPSSPPPSQSPTCVSSANGIPGAGQAYVGATVSGTVSMVQREAYYGQSMPIHRSYWGGSNSNSGVATAIADVAAKRIPWVSFKLPGSWTNVANGQYDAWANDLITKLDNVNGPVWLAFHHEPENDSQPIGEWVRMQKHLAELVKARHSDNIAYSMIVMGWYQAYGSDNAKKLPALWPGDGLVQIIGLDPYNWYGTLRNDGKMQTNMDYLQGYFNVFNSFASAHGARWAVAETAYTDQAAAIDPAWGSKVFTAMRNSGGIGMSYFDTSYNTGGYSWTLDTAAKLADYKLAMGTSARMC